jgi:hypothetical protein
MSRAQDIQHAREVDTEVARLYGEYHTVANEIAKYRGWIDSAKKSAAKPYNQHEHHQAQYASEIAKYEAKIEELRPIAKVRQDAAWAYDADNYGGWNRFFLVQHIHSNQHCSSFRPTTRVGWLPDVSGLTEAEAVAEHGATLCTICFPTAPVELTTPKADPTVCAGSGGPYDHDRLTGRERAHYSPAGYCPVCGEWTALTARYSGKLRKHKTKGGAK